MDKTGRLFKIKDFRYHSPFYIETGSCNGASIQRALDAGFQTVFSVELDRNFYLECVDKFDEERSKGEVHLWYGKSTDHLAEMLDGTWMKTVILLDAHPAGPGTGGHEDLMAKGNASEFTQHNIITRELEIILADSDNHLIIIDDQNDENEDNKLYQEMLLAKNPTYKFFLYDEQVGNFFYPSKIMVCIPG